MCDGGSEVSRQLGGVEVLIMRDARLDLTLHVESLWEVSLGGGML